MSSADAHKATPHPGSGPCLLCGAIADPTLEHILPQTLWKRFGIDPNREDLAQFWTTLCDAHNQATSALHARPDMMSLIETGEPVTRKTLDHLSDWAVWVTLLFALERGSGVLGAEASRELLLRRFSTGHGGTPKGFRVYAARVAGYVEPADPPRVPYALALFGTPGSTSTPSVDRAVSASRQDRSTPPSPSASARSCCWSWAAPTRRDPITTTAWTRPQLRSGWSASARSAPHSRP
jgi:hypothetical protein